MDKVFNFWIWNDLSLLTYQTHKQMWLYHVKTASILEFSFYSYSWSAILEQNIRKFILIEKCWSFIPSKMRNHIWKKSHFLMILMKLKQLCFHIYVIEDLFQYTSENNKKSHYSFVLILRLNKTIRYVHTKQQITELA